ncbi:17-beta-hydroxysteroid dehydrogenase 14-like [Trichoplusia ni]|uniref:17-beta-hydroxysteroid dehydrogenase 14-like n=1 Tax=Trichoplusia ni TaxID=7111 RepID=A0A7E5VA57_TRINI|nr:17-beta-hydroxysteroid dehydrogenase 14-like [Trichoplusia ni]
MSFNDKVVIVTGGSSGIGAAIAIKFSSLGAKITIVGRNEQKLHAVAKKCENPLILIADVTKENDMKKIVNDTVKHFGKLDILVNNAGIARNTSILNENAMADYDQVMATNIRSCVYLTHLSAPHIIKTKGNIINISSIAALKVLSKQAFTYNASKAALDHFTRSVASELASYGVRVNVVSPGPVRTDFIENLGLDKAQQEAAFDHMRKMTALDRVSDPEEIADLVLFLASDKAKGITGATFVSDNGSMVIAD